MQRLLNPFHSLLYKKQISQTSNLDGPQNPKMKFSGLLGFTFLDYGDRIDTFKTGPEGFFNLQAAQAIAVADGGIFTSGAIII